MDADPRTNVVVFQLNNDTDEIATGRAPTLADDGIRQAWESVKREVRREDVVALHSEWEPSPADASYIEATFPEAAVTFTFSRPAPDGWEEALAAARTTMLDASAEELVSALATSGENRPPGSGEHHSMGARAQGPAGGQGHHPPDDSSRDPANSQKPQPTSDPEHRPATAQEPRPTGDSEHHPKGSQEHQPADGSEHPPTTEQERQPTGSSERSPTTRQEHQPTSNSEHHPASGQGPQPTGSAEHQPATPQEDRPIGDGEDQPAGDGGHHRASGQEPQPTGGAEHESAAAQEDRPSGDGESQPADGGQLAGSGEHQPAADLGGSAAGGGGELLPVLWSESSPRVGLLRAVPHWPVAAGRLHLGLAVVAPTLRGTVGVYHVTYHQLGGLSFDELMAEACEGLAAGLQVQSRETDSGELLTLSGTLVAAMVCLPHFYRRLSELVGSERLVVGLPCPDDVYVAGADSPLVDVVHQLVRESEAPATELVPSVLSVVGDLIEVVFERE